MDQPKVYEFAKEIGMETLVLMDKIRHWKLPVKSHMAELAPEIIDQIRQKLDEESGVKKKKKVAKKKTKKVAKKKTEKVTKKKTKTQVAKVKGTKKVAQTKKTGKKKTVIRRKKSDIEKQAVENQLSEKQVVEKENEILIQKVDQAVIQPPESEISVDNKQTAKTSESPPSASRKREVKMTEQGPISGVKSDISRRNVVGKMDLSKIEKQGVGGRFQKTNTRNIRAGFVAAEDPSMLAMPEEQDSSHRRDKDKRKRLINVSTPSKKDHEQVVPSFISSEFKKREIVFQPKKKRIATNVADFKRTEITTPAAHKRVVKIYGTMKVSDLADFLGAKGQQLIKALMQNGVVCNVNTDLDFETISLIVPEFGYEAENVFKSDDELIGMAAFGDLNAEKVGRPPVVTVMGHVDHGKTTLLDTIRKTRVAKGEAGGITQHMGAYRVKTKIGECTFIDTPGHEAFTAMRARGANATDVVILVVAADDGVMPQTLEAVNHSKQAGVPIIVAVNKMDRPDANPERVKQQLSEHELVPEDWGGSTLFVPISALKGEGIDDLLEQVSLLAEMQELKANPKRSATGLVVESRVEKGQGNVATLLVQDGTLTSGQHVVIGQIACRVRQIFDESGEKIESAGPSYPVEIVGLPESPMAGDTFDVCKDEKTTERIAEQRAHEHLIERQSEQKPPTNLEEIFSEVKTGQLKELPVILKTDVAGTGEAIRSMFGKISTDEVKIKVIHHGVGGISVSDVLLASTAGGLIIGFNTRPDSNARIEARQRAVEIKTYSVVYNLMDEMKAAMSGLLDPDVVEKVLGRAEVRNVFNIPKAGTIAGSFVVEGKITRGSSLRLIRNGTVVYTGKVSSLKRFKDDAKEVASGYECGIGIENFNDIKENDEIEAFFEEEVVRTV